MQTININELQAQISAVIKKVTKGEQVRVMRYSKPVAVILSAQDFEMLRGNCANCIADIRKAVKLVKKSK